MAGSCIVSAASGKTSSLAEIMNSRSKKVVFSTGKIVEDCEVSASQAAESATSSNFTTRDCRSENVMCEPSAPEPSYSWSRTMLRMDSIWERRPNCVELTLGHLGILGVYLYQSRAL